MISKLTFVIFFSYAATAFAQPVINAANFPSAAHSEVYSIADETLISAGNSGPNQVWDFSGITLHITLWAEIAQDIVPVSETPAAASFPDANFCIKNTTMEYNISYNYSNISATAQNALGRFGIWSFPYTETLTVFPEPYQVLNFPFAYNDAIVLSNAATYSYDAYGTLVLPFKTYNNVVRHKYVPADPTQDTYYYWYNANPYYEIMSGRFDSSDMAFSNAEIRVLKNMTFLGVEESNKEAFAVYPNPTSGDLFIKGKAIPEGSAVNVVDMTGKLVLETTISANMLSLKTLSDGVYILKIVDKNQQPLSFHKVIKQ